MTTGLKVIGGIGVAALLALDMATPPAPANTATMSTPAPVEIPSAAENIPVVDTPARTEIPKESVSEIVKEVVEETVPPAVVQETVPKQKAPEAKPQTSRNCHPSYSGCLQMNAGDYDCAGGSGNGPNYTRPVEVYGSDPFDLDRDNDGWGCE